jgi:hypothetical protein
MTKQVQIASWMELYLITFMTREQLQVTTWQLRGNFMTKPYNDR